MITVKKADLLIARNTVIAGTVFCPLEKAAGAVLKEDIRADRDIPPGHKILMDGIALISSALKSGRREFFIQGIQPAGKPVLTLRNSRNCIEVMTGALLPRGCDCVIPVEKILRKDSIAILREGVVAKPWQHIHKKGADRKKGGVVLTKNRPLSPPSIAVAASVGKATLRVSASPKIAVITTGDELVGIRQRPRADQIRKSNSYAVRAALTSRGYADATIFHIRDDREQMAKTLKVILKSYDALVLTGGVSMGKFDFVPAVLDELRVKVIFHKVRQKPGKPFWFGKSREGKPVFALPGNSVSTQVCLYRYVMPCLDRAAGLSSAVQSAVLSRKFFVRTDLTFFLPVRLQPASGGKVSVRPAPISHSGDFVELSESDGFVELKAGRQSFPAGVVVPFYRW